MRYILLGLVVRERKFSRCQQRLWYSVFEEIVFPMTATVTLTTISIESVLETLCTCSMCNAWKRRKRSSRSKTFSHWLAIIVLYFVSAHSTLTFDSSSVCQTRRNHKGCGKINTYCDWNWKTFQSTEQVCCVSKITILFMVHILFACAWPVCLDSNIGNFLSLSHTHIHSLLVKSSCCL